MTCGELEAGGEICTQCSIFVYYDRSAGASLHGGVLGEAVVDATRVESLLYFGSKFVFANTAEVCNLATTLRA